MSTWRWIFAAAALIGLASGPAMLEAAADARPPIRWDDVPFVLAGSLFGSLFVIGMQILRSDPRPSRWAIRLFGPMAVWFTAAGLSAALIALATTGVDPHSLFFLAVGVGTLFGVLICRVMHTRKFPSAL